MKRTLKMSVVLDIQFEYDPDKVDDIDSAMRVAANLANEPNFHTIDSGVQLLKVDKVNYILK